MGGGRKSKSKSKSKSKPKTKAQKMAVANKAKYGGTAKAAAANKAANKAKAKSYTKTSGAATAAAKNKAAMTAKTKAKYTASQAAKKAAPSKGASISKGTTGIGPVSSGAKYSKAVSNATNAPSKKTTGIGPYADGAKYAAALKASPPKFKDGTKVAGIGQQGPASNIKMYDGKMMLDTGAGRPGDVRLKPQYQLPTQTAMLGGDNLGSKLGIAIGSGIVGGALGIKNAVKDAAENLRRINEKKLEGLDQSSLGIGGNLVSSLANQVMGIQPAGAIAMKSADSYGYPSQEAVDKAAGITAGGLNVGGSGFTPSNPSGGSTSRAISDRPASSFNFGPTADGNEYAKNLSEFGMRFGATPEARGKAYEQSLDPNSFKGLSDGTTFGSGPVASGEAYVRGLNTQPFGSVENTMRSVVGKIPLVNRIPGVNTRLLTDKEIADKRVKAAAFREANLVGRKRGSGGARLPVAPLTPEEILLPEQVATAQTGPDYQQAQTGLDPNRLMQIQQQAYQQAFNPYNPLTVGGFNPFFRFFDRRGGQRRGAFRRAFRRD